MKLRKKRWKYKLRTVTKDEILAAMERWDIEIIFSWGAFGLHGLACRVDEVAFRFDYEVDPMYSAGRYFMTHTEEEIAEKIAKEINGEGRLSDEKRAYCIEYLSNAL